MQTYIAKTVAGGGKNTIGSKFEEIEYTYYTQDDARRIGIDYSIRPYPQSLKEGDYILTDDGMVVPVLKVSFNKCAKCREMKIPNGTFLLAHNHKILSTKQNRNVNDAVSRKPGKYLKFVFAAAMVSTGFNAIRAFTIAYQRKCKTSNDIDNIKRLLKDSEVLEIIMTKMEQLYKKAGVQPESIIKRIDRVLEALTEKVENTDSANDAIALSKEVTAVASVMGDWAGFEKTDQNMIAMGGMMLTTVAGPKLLDNNKEVEQSESIFDGDVE